MKNMKKKEAQSLKISKVFGFTRKILDDFLVSSLLLLYFFDEILELFHVVSRIVSSSRGKSTIHFGVSPFLREKVTHFVGSEQKHSLPKKLDEKCSLRSGSSNNN